MCAPSAAGAAPRSLTVSRFISQNASKNEDYSTIANVDGLLLVAGDPASEDEPMKKGTCFQVCCISSCSSQAMTSADHVPQQWLLGYEFPSTILLFRKDKIAVLCSAKKGESDTQPRSLRVS